MKEVRDGDRDQISDVPYQPEPFQSLLRIKEGKWHNLLYRYAALVDISLIILPVRILHYQLRLSPVHVSDELAGLDCSMLVLGYDYGHVLLYGRNILTTKD